MYRKTYVEINLDNLEFNVKNIINKYNDYKYYIGMVKSNAYGHGYYIVKTLIDSGINYLAVSSLDEALEIRKYDKKIDILCTEVIDLDSIKEAISEDVTLTITNLSYLKSLIELNKKCKIHIKIDSGMNRLGVKTKEEFNSMYNLILENKNIELEGLYTHFATPGIKDQYYDLQINNFKEITSDIDLSKIKIIHMSSSFIVLSHPKIDFCNGIRIGTILFGYDISLSGYGNGIKNKLRKLRDDYYIKKYNISPVIRSVKIDLKPAFKIKTNVMEIKNIKKGEIIGYGGNCIAKSDMRVAILPIGYDDGIGTQEENRYVLINNKKYKSVGPISMCMMSVCVDDSVKIMDEVTILGNELTLGYMSRLNNVDIHNTLINTGKVLQRVYIKNNEIDKIL